MLRKQILKLIQKLLQVWSNLKDNMIHRLGGYSETEMVNSFIAGRKAGIAYYKGILKDTMEDINGCDKQTWINIIYNAVCR